MSYLRPVISSPVSAEFAAIAAEIKAKAAVRIQSLNGGIQRWIKTELDDIDTKMRIHRFVPNQPRI